MKRKIDQALLKWKEDPDHYPLLLRGARQIGKTYSVRQLGKASFGDYFELNFEKNPEFKEIFNTLEPKTIVNRIETHFQRKIQPGKSLLFFDEIQECPNAIQFVGQELLANSQPNEDMRLFFWQRDKGTKCAEVDYVISFNSTIIPIKVKAGATGRLRSLQIFIEEKGTPFGLRISSTPLKKDGQIFSIPFYLMHRLHELIS